MLISKIISCLFLFRLLICSWHRWLVARNIIMIIWIRIEGTIESRNDTDVICWGPCIRGNVDIISRSSKGVWIQRSVLLKSCNKPNTCLMLQRVKSYCDDFDKDFGWLGVGCKRLWIFRREGRGHEGWRWEELNVFNIQEGVNGDWWLWFFLFWVREVRWERPFVYSFFSEKEVEVINERK